ncbi:MAG TPA: 50S ribosomal protein L15 [Candidatus Saccharimonadales bacterium]|jgi:large subunit ribosomal protein L15|nr:50S ribosomal protein L15 [Candidatus Saccharimonadales bacterium]
MKYHELDATANKDRKRKGRGIAAGQGKTAGRGTKGQNSRTGHKLRATFMGGQRSLVQAIPKKKGFKSLHAPAQVVYLDELGSITGKVATNESLFADGLIGTPFHAVKVISRGELTKAVAVKVQGASASAQAAITKAGGSFEKVAVPLKVSAKPTE